ncbi:MAG: hypothetical protein QN183_13690 [Armatimonadota bacterium]|nr:hypothetical protein [Armatimonadota bacterium]
MSGPTGIIEASDLDEVERIETELLNRHLAGEEAVSAYLYVLLPSATNRLSKPVVGPTSDYVQQLVRRLNHASRGRIDLHLLPDPPVITDFTVPDERGHPRPWVRVVVGAVDRVTGEVRFGIKEMPRVGTDPVGACYTKAIRKAFEGHPSYDRKLVARFIRTKLRELGYDPDAFAVVGERGGGEWGAFFARARARGVDGRTLRESVVQATGKSLSDVRTPQEAAAAAEVMTRALAAATAPEPAPSPPDEFELVAPAPDDKQRVRELVERLGLHDDEVAQLKRQVGRPGDAARNWARLRRALEQMAADRASTSPQDEHGDHAG